MCKYDENPLKSHGGLTYLILCSRMKVNQIYIGSSYWHPKTPDLSCVPEKKSDLGHIDLCECSHSFWVCLIACCLSLPLRWKCPRTPLSTLISLTTKIASPLPFLNNHRHTHFQSLLDSLVACTGTFCLTAKKQWRRQETLWNCFCSLSSIVKRNNPKDNTSLHFGYSPLWNMTKLQEGFEILIWLIFL